MMLQVIQILFIAYSNSQLIVRLGVTALANVIPDMGAMMSLNLASNKLGVEGAKIIAAVLLGCT
jgi:hypothetical protein